MLTNYKNFFHQQTQWISSKLIMKDSSILKHVATLPCEMFVWKQRHAPELCEANCHATLSHLKQSLKIFVRWRGHHSVNCWKPVYSGHAPLNHKAVVILEGLCWKLLMFWRSEWWGAGARCKWLAKCWPADATVTQSSLASSKSRLGNLSGAGLLRLLWKRHLNGPHLSSASH